jgi:hypothetical protein
MKKDQRGSWYLLTGLIVGLGLGLLYSWIISPVRYVNTEPASLRADFKEQYRALIAAAYLSNGDLQRARARLALLDDPDIAQTIAIQAQLALDRAGPDSEKNGLGLLASALNPASTPMVTVAIPSSTSTETPAPTNSPTPVVVLNADVTPSATPKETRTPAATATPLPSRTPTPTPGEPFVLLEQLLVCDPGVEQPRLLIEALDAASQPVPGVEIIISSDQGEDNFFTGLKPEISPGYADYTMQPGVIYQLRLADGGEAVSGLQAQECEAEDGSRFWGALRLVFIQP